MDKMDIDELENKKLFFQDNDQIEGISPKQEDSELLLEEELRKGFVSPQFVEKDPEEFKKSLQKELENGGEKIEQQETDHKKQVELLKETNWATKYHLIYSKINCAIERILCIIQTKNKFILQRRFEKYRQIASMPRRMQACQAKFIINNLQGSVKKLMQFYSSRVLKVKLHYYLKLWVGQLRKMKGIEELKKRSKEIQDKFKLEFTKQTKKFENLEEKLQLCALESTQLRENERNLRGLLKEREEKERVLKDAIERLKKRDEEDRKLPRSVQDRIQVVESHILDLEAQNRELKDRLGLNETTVGGFVQDMNECLDCIEFTKLEDFDLNELRELDNEKKQERGAGVMDEFRYDYRPTRRRMRDSRRTYGTYDDRNYGTRNYRGRFSQHYNENDYRTQPEDTAFPVEKFRKILIDGVPEAKEMDETEQIKCLEKIDEANQLYRDIVLSNLCICASKSKRMSIEPLPKNTKGIHLPHLEIPLHQKFLYEYKISKCPEKNCVDPECFGYHSEEDRRRKPFFLDEGTFFYYPIICPHSKTCDKETCRFAHNQLEIDFHPLTYKTVICKYDSKDQISCLKRNQFCADAHGINDLRNLKEIFSKLNTSIIMSNATKVPLTAPPDLNLISPPIPRKHHLVSPSKKPIEFSLETYKTEKCSQSVCDIPLCLNYHSILERRRTALLSPRECPKVFIDGQFKEPSLCPDGDECPFCHTFNEFVYHFCNYKTKVCVRAPCELGVACPDIHAEEVQGLGPRAPQEEVKEISNYKLKYKKLKQKVEKLKSQCGKFKCNSCYNSFKEKYIYYSSCRHQLCETCRIPEKCKICDSATPSIEIYLQQYFYYVKKCFRNFKMQSKLGMCIGRNILFFK